MAKMVTLELHEADAMELAEFIEYEIFNHIRNDNEIDNIQWLCLMCDIWRKLYGTEAAGLGLPMENEGGDGT